MQPVNGFEHLDAWRGDDQHGQQFIKGHRLACNRQPAEHALLQSRETRKLLAQQVADATKDQRRDAKKRANLATEEVDNGFGYDLQGQRIAPIELNEALLVSFGSDYFFLHAELLAGSETESCQA
jgi:hypothetical protein